MKNLKTSSCDIEPPTEAQGAHYTLKQSVSASRLHCGSVSLVVKKDDERIGIELDRHAWSDLLAELADV
jgi:hypothetical protein